MWWFQFFLILLLWKNLQCLEEIWFSGKNILSDPRDEIHIHNVSVFESFRLNQTVTKWKSINLKNYAYGFGIADQKLVAFQISSNPETKNVEVKSILNDENNFPPLKDMLVLKDWNYNTNNYKIYVLTLNINNSIGIYNIHNNEMNLFWIWNINHKINNFNIGYDSKYNTNYILLGSYEYLIIYQMVLHPVPKIWMIFSQKITNKLISPNLISHRDKIYLTFAEENTLKIYEFKNNAISNPKLFKFEEITQIIPFSRGSRNYLAVAGFDGAVLEFRRNSKINKLDVLNSNLDGIESWLPIIINDIRREVILFGQRNLQHGSHTSSVIETFLLTQNGLEKYDDIPCSIFGENTHLLNCLTSNQNFQLETTSYFSFNDTLGLLVSQRSDPIFMVAYENVPIENPVEKEIRMLTKTQRSLQDLMDKRFGDVPTFTKTKIRQKPEESDIKPASPAFAEEKDVPDFSSRRKDENVLGKINKLINELTTLQEKMNLLENQENADNFKNILINGSLEVLGEIKVDDVETNKIKGELAIDVLKDVAKKDELINRTVMGVKSFVDLGTDYLKVEILNDIPKDQFIYIEDDNSLKLSNNINFLNSVQINSVESKNINHIDLLNNIPMINNMLDDITFENAIIKDIKLDEINKLNLDSLKTESNPNDIDLDNIFIPGNITVNSVNGEDLNKLISQLVFKNLETYIPGKIHIEGQVTSETAGALYLNHLHFPEEYVFLNNIKGVTFTGSKHFVDSLSAKEVRTLGFVNDIQTSDLLTLTTPQHLQGTVTFQSLELSSKFKLNGTVVGDQVDKFLKNPTLSESSILKANVNFNELEIDGNVIIDGHFNTKHFSTLLSNIVYNDEETSLITSIKEFPEGLFIKSNLTLSSNSINLIPVDQFVTKDTRQTLDVNMLNGDVNFENVEIHDTFHGINVTKLDEEAVKIEGEQFILSTLIFKDDLDVEHLKIKDKWNSIPVDEFYSIKGNRTFDVSLILSEMESKTLEVKDQFVGTITDFNLEQFRNDYLNYGKIQNISEMFIKNASIVNINCDMINDLPFDKYFDALSISKSVVDQVNNTDKKVKNLLVDGRLEIRYFNNSKMEDNLLEKLNQTSLTIKGNVYFSEISVEKLSQNNFIDFVNNIVYKNTTDCEFKGSKHFENGFLVNNLVQTDYLNNVLKENLLTKEGEQIITSPFIISGDVQFLANNTEIFNVNNNSLKLLFNSLECTENNSYSVKGDMMFDRISYMKELNIDGYIDEKNVKEFIDNIVYLNDEINLENLDLLNEVTVLNNLDIKNNLNDVDLSKIVANIAIIGKNISIPAIGVVRFMEAVNISEEVFIESDMKCNLLNNINLEKWKNEAVFLDRGFLPGNYLFEKAEIHDKLFTMYINDICMNYTIPLRSNQNIFQLNCDRAVFSKDVSVGHLVNSYHLPTELNNTVMSNQEQEVFSEIVFRNNTLIQGNIIDLSVINGHGFNKMIVTDKNQIINSPFHFFAKTHVNRNVYVDNLVNFINLTSWEKGVIKLVSNDMQDITAKWHITNNITFEDEITGENSISGFNMVETMNLLDKKINLTTTMEQEFLENYKDICHDINHVSLMAKKQIYKFDTFEYLQQLSFNRSIGATHFFKDGTNFLINYLDSCQSSIYQFCLENFEHNFDVEIGEIEEIIHLKGKELIFVVKNVENKNCFDFRGVNVWHFVNKTFKLVQNIPNQITLQESLVPSVFYGLNKQGVTEFHVDLKNINPVKAYRRWKITEDNCMFVPRGLGTGLALRNGRKIFKLIRNHSVDFDEQSFENEIVRGDIQEIPNTILPGRENNMLSVLNVGPRNNRKTLLAVAYHEKSIVETKWDVIKIFDDIYKGRIFHKLAAYKPSALLSLALENGETLLLVIEDSRKLQVYEYKGIEGFKHRMSANIDGKQIYHLELPFNADTKSHHVVSLVGNNTISFIKTVMLGNSAEEILC